MMALLVSSRATCARRQVGCVLVDRRNHVLSTGYNGVTSGSRHCRGGTPCPGADCAPGQGLHLCEAIHAEENALIQCRDINAIYTAYVTASPCIHCTRKLLNTSCQRVVFLDEYPHPQAQEEWLERGRQWICILQQTDSAI